MRTTKDPGLGSSYRKPVKRLMNPDGSYNIIRRGGLSGFQDFYKYLIEVDIWKFSAIVTGGYLSMNILFALAYLIIGIDGLSGTNPELSDFENALFFSAQTFATVGYGTLAPNNLAINYLALFESFVGLLSFAIATGLLWGRFSRPSLKITFSKNIIITPFEDGMAAMFKMVNLRKNVLLNTKVKCIFTMDKGSGETSFNKEYAQFPLELDFVSFFPLTWTIVHKIDENSPLYGLDVKQLKSRNAEVIVLVETFDETYHQTVLKKHSYGGEQWLDKVRFERNFEANEHGQIELHVNQLDRTIPL